jgi:hypothetical protein
MYSRLAGSYTSALDFTHHYESFYSGDHSPSALMLREVEDRNRSFISRDKMMFP